MDRDDLHELIALLKEEFEAGRIKVNSVPTLEAMGRVRMGADGKVDPSTVSASVRTLARAVVARKARQISKQTSLRDVQHQYFEILERLFDKPYSEMKQHGLTPQALASHMATQDNLVNAFQADSEELANGIHEFWEKFGPTVEVHLQEMRSLKAIFGGDIFPSYTANIACSVGLYTDTIVLPDPLHKLMRFSGITDPRPLFRLTAKHALSALCYKDLALSDLSVPIVVMAPDYLADDYYRAVLRVASEEDTLEHCSRIFGRKFPTMEALTEFLGQFSGVNQLVATFADPNRMLFDTEWTEPLAEQFERYTKETQGDLGLNSEMAAALGSVEQVVFGKMMQINDAVFRGRRYGGTPLIDAPTSWQYLLWKYEYNGTPPRVSNEEGRNLMINRAIEIEGHEYGMLSGLPPDALIELRRNGASIELREVIRKGVADINSASDSTLSEVGKAVIENIDNAFAEHDRQLKSLSSSRMKFYGVDVGRYLLFGGISIAAPIVHSMPLDMLLAVAPVDAFSEGTVEDFPRAESKSRKFGPVACRHSLSAHRGELRILIAAGGHPAG